MKTRFLGQKGFEFILLTILMVTFGTLNISYAQEGEPTITASVQVPLTEANLHGSVVTLTLSGGRFVDSERRIENALSVSGIDGVIAFVVDGVNDTEVPIVLGFASDIDTDATLTFTVKADAIVDYNGNALTATLPVTAVEESLEASTEAPLTEATLHGSVVSLTLSGKQFADKREIGRALTLSGIDGVAFERWDVERVSDTVATVPLTFSGNIDTDINLVFTVEAKAIEGYSGNALTTTLPVTAVEESLEASTAAPLTEATLDGSTITLTLTGRHFARRWDIEDAVSISGIEGVIIEDVEREGDTVVTVELEFAGNIDTDATLTLTVGVNAIIGYNKAFTVQLPVPAVEESLVATTAAPLTEATLHGSTITLTLSGRQFVDVWVIRRALSGSSTELPTPPLVAPPVLKPDDGRALSVSGIDGITVNSQDVERISGTEVTVALTFSGNIDIDATLTLTVGPDAIVGGYDKNFTFQFPVTALQESLEASTEAPLTEATLHGSTITLTLSGRQFVDEWVIRRALSISGIEGVTVAGYGAVDRMSDTVATVELDFDGTDFDTDATLTLTVGAEAINYNKDFTFQLPVTAIQQSNATVSISPASVVCPDIGEALTFNLNIKGGENVAGYQATVLSDISALDYVDSTNDNYLPADAFFMPPVVDYSRIEGRWKRSVTLAASTLAGPSNGDGTLATLTFEVEDFKASTLTLSQVYLVDADGKRWEVTLEGGEVTIPPEPAEAILGDINRDGVVNIQDLIIVNVRFGRSGENSADINGDRIVNILDLVLVAGAFGNGAAAPALHLQSLEMLTAADIQRWLSQAQQLELTDATFLKGIRFLEQRLAALIPKENALLPNYPNPFNPETWIPYWLSKPADVTLTIYAVDGQIVRRLALGHQPAGIYQTRSRAAHWDGKNAIGELVASGVYFYTLTAGDFSATRRMLIMK